MRASLLSEREIFQGLVAFRSWVEGIPFPLVSTNIQRRQRSPLPAVPLVSPYHIEAIDLPGAAGHAEGTFRVAVLGLSRIPKWPRYSMHTAQFDIGDPAQAAAFALEEIEDKADFVVAMVDMPLSDARRLAEQVVGIDLILGSHGGLTPKGEIEGVNRFGDTRLVYCKPQGVDVAEVRLFPQRTDSGEWIVKPEIQRVRLKEHYPVDPEGQEIVDRVLAEIDLLNASQSPPPVPVDTADE